jgi:nitrogen fixation protein FixH
MNTYIIYFLIVLATGYALFFKAHLWVRIIVFCNVILLLIALEGWKGLVIDSGQLIEKPSCEIK